MKPWPADAIEKWPIEKLVPYARNSRIHSDVQISSLAASLSEWGWTMPCLVAEDGALIAGHGRVLAARKLGIESIPVVIAKGWTDTQIRAYRIADNKLTENGGWNEDMLRLEFEDLRAADFDLALTGFDEAELAGFAGASGDVLPPADTGGAGSLAERFLIPPFSVLNAREGWWQARKAAWIALGIQSELGRGENLALPPGADDGEGGLINDAYRRQAKARGLPGVIRRK